MLLLLAGLPGTGKSTFAQDMMRERQHVHYDLERAESWPRPDLHPLWGQDRTAFARAAAQAHPAGVVLDWGFPPTLLGWVEELRAAGFTLVWFSATESAARKSFLTRSPKDEVCFDAQVARITKAGFPSALNAVEVEAIGPTGHRSWRWILERIEAAASSPQGGPEGAG